MIAIVDMLIGYPADVARNAARIRPALRQGIGFGVMAEPEALFHKPGWFTRNVFNRLVAGLNRLGLGVQGSETLAVRGRKSGELRTTPVNPMQLDGQTYLLAPRGTTQWVRNLRVANEGELRHGRKVRRFRAEEVPDSEKLPLLRLYIEKWAWEVKGFLGIDADAADEELRRIAPDHPAFRLTFVD
jgi:deazaflavin-dependent oxidoreductase (nitroreductase family)